MNLCYSSGARNDHHPRAPCLIVLSSEADERGYMADRRWFDPTDLAISSMSTILDGIANAFAEPFRQSKRDTRPSSSPRAAGVSQPLRERSEYVEDDFDDDWTPSESSTSDSAAQYDAIPESVRPAVEQLKDTLKDVPGIESQDIVRFCSDKRNWPILKLLLTVGIAVFGIAVIAALIGAQHDPTLQKRQDPPGTPGPDKRNPYKSDA